MISFNRSHASYHLKFGAEMVGENQTAEMTWFPHRHLFVNYLVD